MNRSLARVCLAIIVGLGLSIPATVAYLTYNNQSSVEQIRQTAENVCLTIHHNDLATLECLNYTNESLVSLAHTRLLVDRSVGENSVEGVVGLIPSAREPMASSEASLQDGNDYGVLDESLRFRVGASFDNSRAGHVIPWITKLGQKYSLQSDALPLFLSHFEENPSEINDEIKSEDAFRVVSTQINESEIYEVAGLFETTNLMLSSIFDPDNASDKTFKYFYPVNTKSDTFKDTDLGQIFFEDWDSRVFGIKAENLVFVFGGSDASNLFELLVNDHKGEMRAQGVVLGVVTSENVGIPNKFIQILGPVGFDYRTD